jgi:hypothetical protein
MEGVISGVEEEIPKVSDIFELQGDAAMREVENAYLR